MSTDIEPVDTVTAKPYSRPMGYLIIKPVSPVSLRPVGPGTAAGYIEGVSYMPVPGGVLIRDRERTTA